MNEKEKADCIIELHKEESNRHTHLTSLEFKVNVSLWTFIILAGYFLLREILPKLSNQQASLLGIVYLLISVLLTVAHYHLWMFPITKSQAISTFFVRSYQCRIEELADFKISSNPLTSKPNITRFANFQENYKYWIIVEVGITGALLLFILIFGFSQVLIR